MNIEALTGQSDRDLSIKLGKHKNYVTSTRYRTHRTYEEIIDYVLDQVPSNCEYRGFKWKSNTDLSRKLGKYDDYVGKRRREGKTYADIINSVLDTNK